MTYEIPPKFAFYPYEMNSEDNGCVWYIGYMVPLDADAGTVAKIKRKVKSRLVS